MLLAIRDIMHAIFDEHMIASNLLCLSSQQDSPDDGRGLGGGGTSGFSSSTPEKKALRWARLGLCTVKGSSLTWEGEGRGGEGRGGEGRGGEGRGGEGRGEGRQ